MNQPTREEEKVNMIGCIGDSLQSKSSQRRECPKNFECFSHKMKLDIVTHRVLSSHSPCLSFSQTVSKRDLQRRQKNLVTNLRETPSKMKTVTMMGVMTTLSHMISSEE